VDDQDLHEVARTSGPGDLVTSTERVGDCVVVNLVGDVDLYTSPAARAAVEHALRLSHRTFVINLSGVTFMGSKGMQILLDAVDAASGRGVELRIITGAAVVDRALHVAELYLRLPLYPTRKLALS
jgi:anti-anti-sigma factor